MLRASLKTTVFLVLALSLVGSAAAAYASGNGLHAALSDGVIKHGRLY